MASTSDTFQKHDLWSAARAGEIAVIKRLLAAGHDINARDARGYSPLMLSVYAGREDGSRLLLERGADPNSRDLGGNTILMGAAFKGHLALARALIRAGADPTARNEGGLTALDFANTFDRAQMAGYLREIKSSIPTGGAFAFWRFLTGRLKPRRP